MAWSQEDKAISPGHDARSAENRGFFECQEFTNMQKCIQGDQ